MGSVETTQTESRVLMAWGWLFQPHTQRSASIEQWPQQASLQMLDQEENQPHAFTR